MTETKQEDQGLVQRFMSWLSPKAEDSPERTDDGKWLVDWDTTLSQILDYMSGAGTIWAGQKLVISRDVALTYAVMARCSTLISAVCAGLITGGQLRVVDHQRKRQSSRRVERVLETLATSPDGGQSSSFSFWEDCIADYCFDGNALVVPSVTVDGMLNGFRRMASWDGETTHTREGRVVYRLTPADGKFSTETIAARDMIHARWPRLQGSEYTKRTSRQGFAVPPITALTPAIGIGIRGDKYILGWFDSGAKSKTHFNYNLKEGQPLLTDAQQQQFQEWILKQAKSGAPIITQGIDSNSIDDTPQDRNAFQLRQQQIEEIARFYGVPAPLVGITMTQWGSGIEQLSKMFLKFCVMHHLDRFLRPMGLRLLPKGMFFLADTTDLLRGDSDAISKLLSVGMGGPNSPRIYTFEESRHIAGLSADPEGTFDYPTDKVEEDSGTGNGGGDGSGEGDDGGNAQPPSAPPAPPPIQQDKEVDVRCTECDRLLGKSTIFSFAQVKCRHCNKIKTHDGRPKRRRGNEKAPAK